PPASGPSIRLPSVLTTLTRDEAALHRQLVHRQAHGLAGDLLVHTGDLEHDPARLDVGDPPLGRALAGTHPGLGRLLRQRTVRVDVDPDLAAPLHVAGHGDTCGLDLTVGDVGRRERLEPVVTEGDGRAALRHAGTL